MEIRFWGKIFRSNWLPKIFDYAAVIDEDGNFLDIEKSGRLHKTDNGLIFFVARSIDNHDETVVPIILEALAECVRKNLKTDGFQKVTKDAYQIASKKIYDSPKMGNYGGCVTTIYVKEDKAIISHVGDSRIYIFRNEIFGQITTEHTLAFELIKAGIACDYTMFYPIIYSINGNKDTFIENIDFIELELKKGDKFILLTREIWYKTSDFLSWTELGELFSEVFEADFVSEKKKQIIENFLGEDRFYDAPVVVFQLK